MRRERDYEARCLRLGQSSGNLRWQRGLTQRSSGGDGRGSDDGAQMEKPTPGLWLIGSRVCTTSLAQEPLAASESESRTWNGGHRERWSKTPRRCRPPGDAFNGPRDGPVTGVGQPYLANASVLAPFEPGPQILDTANSITDKDTAAIPPGGIRHSRESGECSVLDQGFCWAWMEVILYVGGPPRFRPLQSFRATRSRVLLGKTSLRMTLGSTNESVHY
jgi:hypothetical protein